MKTISLIETNRLGRKNADYLEPSASSFIRFSLGFKYTLKKPSIFRPAHDSANCGHVPAAGGERLDRREPQPLAVAGDDRAFFVQILHVSSSSGHQAW
jgi:hypothetical protein